MRVPNESLTGWNQIDIGKFATAMWGGEEAGAEACVLILTCQLTLVIILTTAANKAAEGVRLCLNDGLPEAVGDALFQKDSVGQLGGSALVAAKPCTCY